MMDPRDVWDRLRNEATSTKGLLALRIVPESSQNIFLAITSPHAHPVMFLELESSVAPYGQDLASPKALRVYYEKFGVNRVRIVLELMIPEYEDLFAVLVNDIIDLIQTTLGEEEAYHEFSDRLSKWQAFFARYRPGGLSSSEQQGLFGELWFLREYCISSLAPLDAVETWVGPYQDQQDFRFKGCKVEVKTIEANQSIIRIAGERQLDNPDGESIMLFLLTVLLSKGGKESLPDLVGDIRQRIGADESATKLFHDRLLMSGFLDNEAILYETQTYEVRGQQFFSVSEDFPRIVTQDLRHGVTSVRYGIQVISCLPYLMGFSQATKQMGVTH